MLLPSPWASMASHFALMPRWKSASNSSGFRGTQPWTTKCLTCWFDSSFSSKPSALPPAAVGAGDGRSAPAVPLRRQASAWRRRRFGRRAMRLCGHRRVRCSLTTPLQRLKSLTGSRRCPGSNGARPRGLQAREARLLARPENKSRGVWIKMYFAPTKCVHVFCSRKAARGGAVTLGAELRAWSPHYHAASAPFHKG